MHFSQPLLQGAVFVDQRGIGKIVSARLGVPIVAIGALGIYTSVTRSLACHGRMSVLDKPHVQRGQCAQDRPPPGDDLVDALQQTKSRQLP